MKRSKKCVNPDLGGLYHFLALWEDHNRTRKCRLWVMRIFNLWAALALTISKSADRLFPWSPCGNILIIFTSSPTGAPSASAMLGVHGGGTEDGCIHVSLLAKLIE